MEIMTTQTPQLLAAPHSLDNPCHISASHPPDATAHYAKCPTRERTVVVFDWDDTLCPSSWLHANNLLPKCRGDPVFLSAQQQKTLETISSNVIRIIKKAVSFGPVFIVTAAEYGWVELSCSLFMQSAQEILDLPDVHVVSARTWYEQTFGYEGNANCWKYEVMQLIAQKCFAESSTSLDTYFNFVSIGDSMAERDACHLAIENISNTYAKTLKYVEQPGSEELIQQLQLTFESFDQMCTWENSLDLQLTRSQLQELQNLNKTNTI
uniref:Protein kinase putative n=1 Tax=Albugo laibachii Nc14 TaxID=890382 RepID=F0VZE0_9STRA|nr:protein kinase putative [Albugo laibachii Nc14]|eukprot:CCA14170.1 protein kinase putative [Albugo laibachii Nc14]